MFIAAWSFDLQYGTRDEALRALRESKSMVESVQGWKSKRSRLLSGSIGAPESRMIIEHEFASLADLESSWEALHKNASTFQNLVKQLKGVMVGGSPRWEIYRVMDESK